MPFEFNPKRPLSAEVPHLMATQIARIEAHLRSSDSAEERVHDARKRIKETRALLRLIAPVLDSQFAVENAWYREAGRQLSAARDAAALGESVEKLRKRAKDRAIARQLKSIRKALEKSEDEGEERIDALLEKLPDARDRIEKWPAMPDDFTAIGDGLQKCFRDGRSALDAAQTTPTPETFHELRKRVKDHWYHSQLLRRTWPDFMESYAELVEKVSDALGDHHDLIVLRQTLTDDPQSFGGEATLHSAFGAIEKRREQLEKKSTKIASHVFAEKPGSWRKRVEEWWRLAS